MRKLEAERTISASVKKGLENRQNRINSLGEKLAKATELEEQALINRQIREEMAQMEKEKNRQLLTDKQRDMLRREATERLFCHADIIATTLSSSMNGQMEARKTMNT